MLMLFFLLLLLSLPCSLVVIPKAKQWNLLSPLSLLFLLSSPQGICCLPWFSTTHRCPPARSRESIQQYSQPSLPPAHRTIYAKLHQP